MVHTLQPGFSYAQRRSKAIALTLQLHGMVHAVLYAAPYHLTSSEVGSSKGRSVLAKLRIGYRSWFRVEVVRVVPFASRGDEAGAPST
jgi:hypothetical protein